MKKLLSDLFISLGIPILFTLIIMSLFWAKDFEWKKIRKRQWDETKERSAQLNTGTSMIAPFLLSKGYDTTAIIALDYMINLKTKP